MENHDFPTPRVNRSRPAIGTYPPGATLGPRTLRDFELVWITTGSADWSWIDGGVELVLEPGMLLLTRPGMLEEFRWGRREPARHGYVHFDLEPRPDTTGWPLVRSAVAPGPIAGLLDYLLWLAEEPVRDWLEHVEETVGTLLRIFLSAPLPDAHEPVEHPAVAAALDHVREEWGRQLRPVALGELAATANASKEHLARLFRQHYGTGMIGALELIRLDHAETLLTRTNSSVAEVASSCGFGDPLHFSKRFRAAFGASPRAYRHGTARPSPLATAGLLRLSRRVTAG